DDARNVDDRALVGPGADLLFAVRRPHTEENLATVGARDFRMAYDLSPDRSRHEMPHVDARTHCALARLEVLLYGIQCRVFHDENQVRRREHRWQDTVLEPVRQICRLNAKHILALRTARNRFHGSSRMTWCLGEGSNARNFLKRFLELRNRGGVPPATLLAGECLLIRTFSSNRSG